MPEVRPGEVHYVGARARAPATPKHGQPCTADGFVGIAIKQQPPPGGTGLNDPAHTTIGATEAFIIQIKGRVYIDNTVTGIAGGGALSAIKGSPIYMTLATGVLNIAGPASATVARFGRCTEIAGERGVGTGKIRVDLDAKDGLL